MKLGIKKAFFLKSIHEGIKKNENSVDIWFSMTCYCLLTIYYAQLEHEKL